MVRWWTVLRRKKKAKNQTCCLDAIRALFNSPGRKGHLCPVVPWWASSAMTKATHTAARGTRPRRQAPASYTAVAFANIPIVREPDRRSFRYGAPRCRIYRPASSPLQWCGSGRRRWSLAFEPVSAPAIEPLMGWTASDDPFAQIRLTSPNRTAAIDDAERRVLDYHVAE